MGTIQITVDGIDLKVKDHTSILDAVTQADFKYWDLHIPTLYYLKGVNDVDESGVCLVEMENGDIVNASTTRVKAGMKIETKSPKVIEQQKEALRRLLAIHDKDCIHCKRSGYNCEFQQILEKFGFTGEDETFQEEDKVELDLSSKVLVRDNNKCIRCRRCINVCAKMQAVSAIVCTGEGLNAEIRPSSPDGLAAASCVNCGQCVAVCPTGALTEKDSTWEVKSAIKEPDMFTIVQVAPAVRAQIGECFEFNIGVDTEGRIANALRELGFDKVFDTKFGADLTIMEEANELIDRIKNDGVLPMFTSCCPGWIKYAEHFYPDMLDHISSCKAPHTMFGAVCKSYYAEKLGIDKNKIFVVSVMPCTAKKFEITRDDMNGAGVPDVDAVITTRELADMIKDAEIQFEFMNPADKFDDPLGFGTGAGVIFGTTGGVMEAALRTAESVLTQQEPKDIDFTEVRGMNGIKEAEYTIKGMPVKVAVASGLANANQLLTAVKEGKADYQFIEIMACPGGCVNGGGQPYQTALTHALCDIPRERAQALYRNDAKADIRMSHENPAIQKLYEEYLDRPNSEKAHELLHTTYVMR